MEELALVISNPVDGQWLKHIDWNKEQIAEGINAIVADYQNLAYSEDQLQEAKKDRAKLNKLKKEIEDRRKQVKKIVNLPYDLFEKEVAEVSTALTEAISGIDQQIKGFEEKEKERKKAEILSLFSEALGDLSGKVDSTKLFNASWLNASVSMKRVKEEIDAKVQTIRSGYEYISNLADDEKVIAIAEYEKSYDIGMAIAEVNRHRTVQKRLEEEKAREGHEKAAERLINKLEGKDVVNGMPAEEKQQEEPLRSEEEPEEKKDRLEAACAESRNEKTPESDDPKVMTSISVVINGETAGMLLDLIRKNNVAFRGVVNMQLLGTKAELMELVQNLKDAGIRIGGTKNAQN